MNTEHTERMAYYSAVAAGDFPRAVHIRAGRDSGWCVPSMGDFLARKFGEQFTHAICEGAHCDIANQWDSYPILDAHKAFGKSRLAMADTLHLIWRPDIDLVELIEMSVRVGKWAGASYESRRRESEKVGGA